jgi:hypothetical protein
MHCESVIQQDTKIFVEVCPWNELSTNFSRGFEGLSNVLVEGIHMAADFFTPELQANSNIKLNSKQKTSLIGNIKTTYWECEQTSEMF